MIDNLVAFQQSRCDMRELWAVVPMGHGKTLNSLIKYIEHLESQLQLRNRS